MPILLRISMHHGHVLVVIFSNACIMYLNTHEMYLIRSHLFAESYDSNSDINAPFGKWSCKFKFHGALQKYHKWSNKFTYSLKTIYKSWHMVLVQKMFIFITTSPVLMIIIHNFTCLRTVARRCIQTRSNWRREVWVYTWIANVNNVINNVLKSPTFYTIIVDQV